MATESGSVGPGSAQPGGAGSASVKPGGAKSRRWAAGETLLGLKRRARRINRALAEAYPYAHAELDFRSPFELVVATVLSAQTTDVTVNQITPLLFARYPDARSLAEAEPAGKPPTESSATPSESPESPWTPTSAAWPAASGGPTRTTPSRSNPTSP